MKEPAIGAWITLNASYYFGPHCDPCGLLDDASLLLSGAHGITQSLSDLLGQGEDINPNDLANALWGASMLIHMGQRSAEEAHGRIRKMVGYPK
jgi:hypothetical protein